MLKNAMITGVIVIASLLSVWMLTTVAVEYRSASEQVVDENIKSVEPPYKRQLAQFPPAQQKNLLTQTASVPRETIEQNTYKEQHKEIVQSDQQKDNSDSSKDVLDILDPNTDGLANETNSSPIYSREQQTEQNFDQLALMLEAESYDDVWANDRTQQLTELFSQHSPVGNELVQTDCRSTFCRIDISHVDDQAEQAFINEMIASQQFIDDGEQGSYQRQVDSNGAIRTVFYSAREGHRLPASDQDTEQ